MIEEKKDRELFDRIAYDYSKKHINPVSRVARKFQFMSVIELCPKKHFNKILELGCGPGYNSIYLKNQFHQFIGLDYSEKFIEIANELKVENASFIQGNIKDLSFLKGSNFDLILGVGIIHHVDDINEVLRNIKMICRDDTIVAFIEPFSGNLFIQLLRNIRKLIDRSYSEDQRFFKKNEIFEMFKNNGFEIDKFKYQGYFSTPFAQVILKPGLLFKPLCKLSIILDKFLQNKFNNPLSWNIIWTARKKSDQ